MIPGHDSKERCDRCGRLLKSVGPWPFITQRIYQRLDQSLVLWRSRSHRKGFRANNTGRSSRMAAILRRSVWQPQQLNWWISVIFAVGSFLFMLGSIFSLAPTLTRDWALEANTINRIFFAGSIPFTTAAYLQLFQAANASKPLPHRSLLPVVLIGWFPQEIGWLSCALQFPGTVLFNINTFDAMLPGLDWLHQDLKIWVPDFIGSILFLLSGYLAFIETCHTHWAWKPDSLSWWVTFINLLGCIGFMISAVFAVVLPRSPRVDIVTISVAFTLLGAVGFLIGSLLMLPESALATESSSDQN